MDGKQITAAIASVILVAVMLFVSIIVVGQLYTATPNVTTPVTNETFAAGTGWDDNATGGMSIPINLANDYIDNSSLVITNYTTGAAYVRSGNFSMNSSQQEGGNFSLLGFEGRREAAMTDAGILNNTNYNASYTHTDRPQSLYDLMPVISNSFMLLGVGLIVLAAAVVITILRRSLTT